MIFSPAPRNINENSSAAQRRRLLKFDYYSFQERVSLIVPWIVGLITFMALEAVAVVYSNVLRDHVNKVSCAKRTHTTYIHACMCDVMSEAI